MPRFPGGFPCTRRQDPPPSTAPTPVRDRHPQLRCGGPEGPAPRMSPASRSLRSAIHGRVGRVRRTMRPTLPCASPTPSPGGQFADERSPDQSALRRPCHFQTNGSPRSPRGIRASARRLPRGGTGPFAGPRGTGSFAVSNQGPRVTALAAEPIPGMKFQSLDLANDMHAQGSETEQAMTTTPHRSRR